MKGPVYIYIHMYVYIHTHIFLFIFKRRPFQDQLSIYPLIIARLLHRLVQRAQAGPQLVQMFIGSLDPGSPGVVIPRSSSLR